MNRKRRTSRAAQSTAPKPFIFVLMPFHRSFDDVYAFGIKGAAEDVDAYAERLDEQMFDEGMLERIFNQVSRADVIVADMTGRNANVFYEVGYAHALNKVVLLLTKDARDIPFDLQHRPHTVYGGNITKLRSELVKRLIWAIEESKKRRRQGTTTTTLAISLWGRAIPEMAAGAEPPRFEFTLRPEHRGKEFVVVFDVRNDGFETSEEVSHIYLFTPTTPTMIPVLANPFGGGFYLATTGTFTNEPAALPELYAAKADELKLSLGRQFRLRSNLAAIPPGAVEPLYVSLQPKGGPTWISRFCLRLHTSGGPQDFPFSFEVAIEGDRPKENRPSDGDG